MPLPFYCPTVYAMEMKWIPEKYFWLEKVFCFRTTAKSGAFGNVQTNCVIKHSA